MHACMLVCMHVCICIHIHSLEIHSTGENALPSLVESSLFGYQHSKHSKVKLMTDFSTPSVRNYRKQKEIDHQRPCIGLNINGKVHTLGEKTKN